MKAIEQQAEFRITYTMTFEEASLILRMCDGYVSLGSHLAKISAKFPEDERTLQLMLMKLAEGFGEEIRRAEDAKLVYSGKKVAVDPVYLKRLQAAQAEVESARIEKENK